jgi:hypothetical protein
MQSVKLKVVAILKYNDLKTGCQETSCNRAIANIRLSSSHISCISSQTYASWKAAGNRRMLSANFPWLLKNWTYAPSTKTLPPAFFSIYSSRRRGVKPQFLETMIFWRPGNLYCDRRRASRAVARSVIC